MKAKVLVADDSITIQKIVAMSFENEDIVVTSVNNGKLAFEKLAEVRPDVVLADTDMPGLTGYQLCQKIKESNEFSSVKVILLSSDFEDFSEDLYKSSKADGRLTKPFKSDEIVKKVNEMLHGAPAGGDSEEPVLLSLSATDIMDDADLPQAILLD
jgi:CheY-like chemotaxis protein